MRCGLLGKKLGHSYSPIIHSQLADYRYELFEKQENELGEFLRSGCFDGLNVTIPYKKAVIPYLDEISDAARSIGSVNTIVRRADGTLFGDNTDAAGFMAMLVSLDADVRGKKCLVLGSGGASVMAQYVPCGDVKGVDQLERGITQEEYDAVLEHMDDLGMENGFVQDLESSSTQFIPKFDLTGV